MFTKGCMVAALLGMAMALPRPDERPQYPDERPQYEERPQYFDEPQYGPPPQGYPVEEYVEPPKPYAFDFGVKDDYSGAQFGHNENSDSEGIVKGSYIVALPDGRIQKVEYVAHPKDGYKATVSYEGEATYPEAKPYEPQQYQPQQYQPQYAPLQPQEYAPAESQYAPVEQRQNAPELPVYQPEEREAATPIEE